MALLEGANPFLSPEAAGEHHYNPQFMSILNYTYPVTNRLLIQADAMRQAYHRHQKRQFGGTDARVTTDDIAVTDLGSNLNYGSRASGYTVFPDDRWHERMSLSYVTGSHNFKAGIDLNQFSIGRKDYSDIHTSQPGPVVHVPQPGARLGDDLCLSIGHVQHLDGKRGLCAGSMDHAAADAQSGRPLQRV